MLYLVDGYNITRADDATRRLPLDRQRDALVARLRVRGPDMLGRGRIVVVFDGRPEPGEGGEAGGPVEVVFSRGESADDLITRLAASAEEKIVLVSSDGELRDRVRAAAVHGVELRSSSSAWEEPRAGARRRGKGRGRFPASTAGLPPGANRITEEMKRIWLEGGDDSGKETEE
ncbi:MAG: NYN domain-containing protein [Coriobacteriia bacterium]|nr:NYN domain-containing protein [Coriobacteriia bacterium]